jgi:hypothetical protein
MSIAVTYSRFGYFNKKKREEKGKKGPSGDVFPIQTKHCVSSGPRSPTKIKGEKEEAQGMRINLPHFCNPPRRALRNIVAFTGVFIAILTTGILLVQWRSASPAAHVRPSVAEDSKNAQVVVKKPVFYPPMGQIPWWTTEQERPKFAYAQYATNLDYLCNSVGVGFFFAFIL